MKLKILCTLCLLLAAVYISNAQKTVTLNVHNVPANDIFRMIESQSEYTIFCNPKDIDSLFLSVQCQNVLPDVALIQALGGTPLKVSSFEKYLFVLKDQIIETSITSDFFESTTRREISVNDAPLIDLSPVEKKATSENRLYIIGNETIPNPSQRATLTGVITYVNTGEPVVGVVLFTEDTRYTATSDAFGFYSLRLPTGRQKILIKGLGMKDTQRNLEIFSDGKMNVELEEEVFSLREIVVVSERHMRVRNTNLGVERVQISEIKNIPTAFGESDVIKIVMMLPGVKTVGEIGRTSCRERV